MSFHSRRHRALRQRCHEGEAETIIEQADVVVAGRPGLLRAESVTLTWSYEPSDPSVGFHGGVGHICLKEPFAAIVSFDDTGDECPAYVCWGSPLWEQVWKSEKRSFGRVCEDAFENEIAEPDEH